MTPRPYFQLIMTACPIWANNFPGALLSQEIAGQRLWDVLAESNGVSKYWNKNTLSSLLALDEESSRLNPLRA